MENFIVDDLGHTYFVLEKGSDFTNEEIKLVIELGYELLEDTIRKNSNKEENNILISLKKQFVYFKAKKFKEYSQYFIINNSGELCSILPIDASHETDFASIVAKYIFILKRFFDSTIDTKNIRTSVIKKLDMLFDEKTMLEWKQIKQTDFNRFINKRLGQSSNLSEFNNIWIKKTINRELNNFHLSVDTKLELLNEVTTKTSQLLEDGKKEIAQYSKEIRGFRTTLSNLKQKSENQLSLQNDDIINANNEFKEILDRAKEFAKYKQLDEYFSDKSEDNKTKAKDWMRRFGGILILSIAVLIFWFYNYSDKLPVLDKDKYELGRALFMALPVIAVVWILRICIKLSTHHLRLQEDAENKAILLRTLSAFEAENDNFNHEGQLIAYNAIFRASLSDNNDLDVATPSLGEIITAARLKK